jgi:hypothetical protein
MKVADDQDVDVGEQAEEPLDDEDRQRQRDPFRRGIGARAARDRPANAPAQPDELADGGEVGGGDHRAHRRDGGGRRSVEERQPHEEDDEQRPDDEARPQAQVGPVEAARDPVLYLADRLHRQHDGAEVERDQIVALEVIAEDARPAAPMPATSVAERRALRRLPRMMPRSSDVARGRGIPEQGAAPRSGSRDRQARRE